VVAKRARYRSKIARTVHETVRGLHRIGLADKRTMRQFDISCLTSVEDLTPRQIQALREREDVSQAVFAGYLNVRPGLVSQWERGEKKPSGPSLKLLAIVQARGLDAIA
jgi:putative transcriptional regulator